MAVRRNGGLVAILDAPGIGLKLVPDIEHAFPRAPIRSACLRIKMGRWRMIESDLF
jgi:hypothetical protein